MMASPAFDLFYIRPMPIRRPGEAHVLVKLTHAELPPPEHATASGRAPPDRLLHFALPSAVRLDASALERPCSTVEFCLTDHAGARAFGCALTALDAADDGGVQLWGVVALSSSAIVEVFRTLLLSLYAQRAVHSLGEPDQPPARSLGRFCARAAAEMACCAPVLSFVGGHHLWSGVSLQPLCKALQWSAPELAYLLLCVLTDARVLLVSERRELPYRATTALQALVSPLAVQGVFVPFLPATLLGADEAATLLNDCAQPYLIGCERCLAERAAPLSDGLVVVDLDAPYAPASAGVAAQIRRPRGSPAALERSALMQMRSVRTLCLRLQEGMGECVRYKEHVVQSACLQFVLTFCDARGRALAHAAAQPHTQPPHADERALGNALGCLGEFSAEVDARFAVRVDEPLARAELRRALRSAEAALLARFVERIAGERELSAAARCALSAPLLELVWRAMPFATWWQARTDADGIGHLLHRGGTSDSELREYVREHVHSLRQLQADVERRLLAALLDAADAHDDDGGERARAREPAGAARGAPAADAPSPVQPAGAASAGPSARERAPAIAPHALLDAFAELVAPANAEIVAPANAEIVAPAAPTLNSPFVAEDCERGSRAPPPAAPDLRPIPLS
ncbi:hypothetical protein KFE25_010257 [Diacronema lutheri]|uniref:UDENN domain-containing protein n=1 Tax=Diacronema lutheri TaxID=2081491 RepID=A0A8J6C9T8_DIALT|nr:hypothetical protein KFE25_010257 [Diacronema lutheri]